MSKKSLSTVSLFNLSWAFLLWVVFGAVSGAFIVYLIRFSPSLVWNAQLRIAFLQGAALGAVCQVGIAAALFFLDTTLLFKYLVSKARITSSPLVVSGSLKSLLEQTWFETADSKCMPRIRILPSSERIQLRARAPFRKGEWWISTSYLLSSTDSEIQEDFRQVLKEVPQFECMIQTWTASAALFWAIIGSFLGSFGGSFENSTTHGWSRVGRYIPSLISLSMIHMIRSWVQKSDTNNSLNFDILDLIESR